MNAPNISNSKLLASASTGAVGRAKVSSTSTATLGIGMSSGAKAYKDNWRVDKPVMLIHGLCSSNLRCIKSAEKPAVCAIDSATRGPAQWWMAWWTSAKSWACFPSLPQWEGKNVWLGFDKLMGNIGASDAKGVKCMWAQTPPFA
jgi:hypothetical protein